MPNWTDFIDPAAPAGRYLRWKEVAERTSLSRTTAWRLQKRGQFPCAYVISPGRVGYLEREVDAWKASRARRSGGTGAATPPPERGARVTAEPHPPAKVGELSLRSRPRGAGPQRPPAASPQMRFDF